MRLFRDTAKRALNRHEGRQGKTARRQKSGSWSWNLKLNSRCPRCRRGRLPARRPPVTKYDVALRGFMRIAVLDDDSAQADLVCQTLSAAGHVCHAFDAGRELVRQLRRQTFDLLVLDWNVPDMSGEEVLRWVRDSLSLRLPVLFMTSRGRETDMTFILNTGADDYLVKPVSAPVLLARVGSLLRRAYYLKPPASKEVFGEF